MRAVSSLFYAAVPLLVLAAPLRRTASGGDALIASAYNSFLCSQRLLSIVPDFAITLENLETDFYMQAIAKFTESDIQAAGYTSAQVPLEQFK